MTAVIRDIRLEGGPEATSGGGQQLTRLRSNKNG